MASHRHERAESTLRRELIRIVSHEVRDPAVTGVRVSKVSLSPDKRAARVYIASWDPKAGEMPDDAPLKALTRATPFIRKALARRLRMRHVPELRFEHDLSEQHKQRIDTLLKRIRKRAGKGLAALVAAAAIQPGALGNQSGLERFESSAGVMGSEFRIACYAPSAKLAAGAVTAAFDEVRRIDRFLSNYKPDSELSRINRQAAHGPVHVSVEMTDLLARCLRYSTASEGAFDITVGALVKAWGFYGANGSKPLPWTLWWARRNSGYRYLELDVGENTVRFRRSGLALDPGGIGKGYAVDRAVEVLREYGIGAALVSSGNSSIYALGEPPDTSGGWDLDVRTPNAEGEPAVAVSLKDEALSTSGSYEKYFEEDGKRYSHILDPRTGLPAAGLAAVSVVTARAIDSEAWSTALFVNGPSWARDHPIPDSRVLFCEETGRCGWLQED